MVIFFKRESIVIVVKYVYLMHSKVVVNLSCFLLFESYKLIPNIQNSNFGFTYC